MCNRWHNDQQCVAVLHRCAAWRHGGYLAQAGTNAPYCRTGSVSAVTRSRFAAGGVVRTLGTYPGAQTVCVCVLHHYTEGLPFTTQTQAYVMAADGSSQALEQFAEDPTYQQLEKMLAAGRAAKAPIFKVNCWVTVVIVWGI